MLYKYTVLGPVAENWSESQRLLRNSGTVNEAPVLGRASGAHKVRWTEALTPKERGAYTPHKQKVGGAKDRTQAARTILLEFRGGLTASDSD